MASLTGHEETDTRVADYLDDKLQTIGDLETLDSLLANIRNQHGLLKKQLEDAERDLKEARQAAREHEASLQQQAQQFNKEQADIDRRLMIITQSDASDDAVGRFESSMAKLRNLDVANGYVELLKEVDTLSKESRSQLGKSDTAALEPYRKLQSLSNRLGPLQEAAEGAAPHLLDHVAKIRNSMHRQIKDGFSADLEAVLKKISWPRADATLLGNVLEDFNNCVGKLLDFQIPELEAREAEWSSKTLTKPPIVLLPFEVLVQPLEMRFRYHFEGDRPTNRLEKPEYFLAHVTDLLNSYDGFVTKYLQPILLNLFRGTDLGLNTVYIDATSALITALLPMVRRKVFSILPEVSAQPQLLSHLIHEIMGFDTILREEWGYDGGYRLQGWKGLAWEVLVQKEWFGRWLQVEKDFALARYQSIIDSPDSGEIDYDSVDASATKPTKAAIRVNDLLETITDRYRPLSSFQLKLRFLIEIQIEIFDKLHARLHGSLEAYLTMTSKIGQMVQSVSKEELAALQGVGAFDRLCRVYGSADYLERAMRDWSDDIFFLELWEELQDRARNNRHKNVAGPMSVSDVAERTSSAVGSDDNDTGALFDETAQAYKRLRVRSESIIIDTFVHKIRDILNPYGRVNPWTTLPSTATPAIASTSAVTPELDPALTYLSTSLQFLSRALAPVPLRRITRQGLLAIQAYIWESVLTRHSFSTAGAAQLEADVSAIRRVVNRWVGDGVAESGLRKLLEGVKLIGLPVDGGNAVSAESAEKNQEDNAGKTTDGNALGLWEVDKRLFASNESAREILDQLGMEELTETEARNVLGRRVELASRM